ncbi:MAG TPA: aminoacyl-tRNA hydrolase [Nitrospiria bacterium]
MKILVGLGNPGADYARSRHNVGFMVLDAYAKSLAVSFRKSSPRIHTAHGTVQGRNRNDERVILAKPQTYMNRSGSAVLELLRETGAEPSDLLVVHDELDLDLGRLRLKSKGGHGGHRGVQSIIASLQTHQFYRLRVGIGRPPAHQAADKYVLSVFLPEERSVVQETIKRSVTALDCFIKEGPEATMNRFHS